MIPFKKLSIIQKVNNSSFILFFVILQSTAFSQGLIKVLDFGYNPGNLNAFVYLPLNYEQKASLNLVVAFHGCGQNAENLARITGITQLADQYNCIVLFPQQKMINNPQNCFNWFSKNHYNPDKGEMASIYQMIKYCKERYKIHKQYLYGVSAGACMALNVVYNYPNEFQGVALLAGAPFLGLNNFVEASKWLIAPKILSQSELIQAFQKWKNTDSLSFLPKLVLIHGLNDPVVDIRNAFNIVTQYTALRLSDDIPDSTIDNFTNNPDIQRVEYNDKEGNPLIIFYKVMKLGHEIMVDPGTEPHQGGQLGGLFAKDKNFYSTYYIFKDWGIIE